MFNILTRFIYRELTPHKPFGLETCRRAQVESLRAERFTPPGSGIFDMPGVHQVLQPTAERGGRFYTLDHRIYASIRRYSELLWFLRSNQEESAVSELQITYRGAVYPWQCDHMGHMNVMWYVSKFDEATWQLFSFLGLTSSFLREHDRGMAGVEQNITYKHELRAGDVITIRSSILEMREKVMRYVHEMRNDETGDISAVMICTVVYMDLKTRKSCPFPGNILVRGREMVIECEPGTRVK